MTRFFLFLFCVCACSAYAETERMKDDSFPLNFLPHRRNYLLPITYNSSTHQEPFTSEGIDLDNTELKFQLSVKVPLFRNAMSDIGILWFGYTNLSFWQAYNSDESSPFRETNHEPELFFDFNHDFDVGGWESRFLRVGVVHESNGRGGLLSRSWNRVYGQAAVTDDRWTLQLKGWYRIPEDEKEFPGDTSGDDNPDIDRFIGYGELGIYYQLEKGMLELLLVNNLRSHNRGGVQLGWTFPVSRNISGYLQYYNGYGESLIDYNDSANRIGLGVSFTSPFESIM